MRRRAHLVTMVLWLIRLKDYLDEVMVDRAFWESSKLVKVNMGEMYGHIHCMRNHSSLLLRKGVSPRFLRSSSDCGHGTLFIGKWYSFLNDSGQEWVLTDSL